MQTTKEKVDTSKALDASLVIIEYRGTNMEKQDISRILGNDAHDDDADIQPIYDEEPMVEDAWNTMCCDDIHSCLRLAFPPWRGVTQNIDDDQEEAEMKKHMEIVVNEEEIVVDAKQLDTKPPIIVDWKIIKEGKMGYFQLIRAYGSSRRDSSMIKMI
ncbi:hypothetical protein Tco_0227114 [Tanacetum coccineum]